MGVGLARYKSTNDLQKCTLKKALLAYQHVSLAGPKPYGYMEGRCSAALKLSLSDCGQCHAWLLHVALLSSRSAGTPVEQIIQNGTFSCLTADDWS